MMQATLWHGGGSGTMGAGLPLVITSLNPFARLDHQLRCLSAWKALGFEVLTFNVPDEIDRLRAAGVADGDMLPADPSETGQALHGKPVPRVADLLARIAHLHPGRPLLLVNADIYPAAASPGFVWAWLDQAPVVALTREETIAIGSYTVMMHTPYRGGLDIFAIRAGVVPALLAELDRWPVRDRMCFGIPGWDFLLGAIIRRPEIGGMICDSGLLLHVWHPTTYAGMAEFVHYMPAMQALTGVASTTADDAAYVFHRQIVQDCEAGAALRRQVKGGFFRLPALGQPILPRAVEIARDIRAQAPGLCWSLNLAVLARLIEAVVDRPDIPLAITLPMFASAGDRVQLPDLLAACLMHLQCRREWAVTSDYPANNLHGRALQIVLENTAADPEARLVEVARLFCTELADYGIFNPRLFNWIALSCRNETERSLLCNDLTGVELILMDGGSTDNTAAIVEHYRDIFAIAVSEPDRGQSDAINKGFARATQPILYWLNGDDLILPNALVPMRAAFRDDPEAQVVVGDAWMTEKDFTPIRHFRFSPETLGFEHLLDYAANHLVQPSVFFTRTAWDAAGPVKEELHYAMDADLFLGMAARYRFRHIPVDIGYSVYHEACKTRGKRGESITELALVQARHGGLDQARRTLDILVELFNAAETRAASPQAAPRAPQGMLERRMQAMEEEIEKNRALLIDLDMKLTA